jgi:DNA-binding PadR family transcriptional regulator
MEIGMAEKIRVSGPTLKLLKLLLENPKQGRSGAEISKLTKLGSGTIYPLLQRLEMAKWIEGEWENVDPSEVGRPKRRLYKLTRSGQAAATKELAQYQTSALGITVWTRSRAY